MLVRAYRLTDKLGIVILKLSVAFGGLSTAGVSRFTSVGRRGVGAIFAVIFGVLGIIWGILRRALGLLFGSIGGGARRASQQAAGAVGSSTSNMMARRAARAEMTAAVTEDPLRAQNRTLSAVAVLLLAALIGVILWATGPGRQPSGVTSLADLGNSLALSSTTIPPDATIGAPVLGSTAVPTATVVPSVIVAGGSIAYTAREKGQTDIWALSVGSRTPLRLTNSPTDERDPAWSPDGTKIAYASRQDGNWEIYIYTVLDGSSQRMTYDLSFQGAPKWSPDGKFLTYESYQGNNLDIYVVPVDGSQPALRVTDSSTPDFAPAWSPVNNGRQIAFVSWRNGNQDIYIFSLDNPVDSASINVTNTSNRQENYPAWSPDGKYIAYSALDEGIEKVFVKDVSNIDAPAQVIARGRTPVWSPDGTSLISAVDSAEGTQFVAIPFTATGNTTLVIGSAERATTPSWTGRPLPAALLSTGGLPSGVPQSLFVEQVGSPDRNGHYGLGTLSNVVVSRSEFYLSDTVNDSFNALRQRMLQLTGWDFLGKLDDAFWSFLPTPRLPDAGEERRNWYYTGRAFGITRNLIAGFPQQIELVREDEGVNTYWRVYVRVSEDAAPGELGEPLRQMPWDMLSRNSGDVQAYDEGGRLKTDVPSGYYIDFTQLAMDYGWQRTPAAGDWRANVNGINYWLFQKTDGLTWYDAMLQLYNNSELGAFAATAVPAAPTQTQP
ncbi:MAG: hypothetical protein LCI00_04640 [Chloroflexi bacterium]|nr:hypothetical protein [Chloroflexota bacterium]MCC6892003.1 PD40 domain-containing protein [Anaerolineae bacterium]